MTPKTDSLASWSTCRAMLASYLVPPVVVPIILAIALAAISYALN